MKQLTLPEMHQLLLRMLESIHEYCMENNIRYSLGGGTLLGAIRHKGFIPWDDDVDIMMPRPDYERFLQGFPNQSPHYYLQHWRNDKNYPFLFAEVYDDRTYLEGAKHRKGIYVDVFPIEGLPPVNKQKMYWDRFNKCCLLENIRKYPFGRFSWKRKLFAVFTFPIWYFVPIYKIKEYTEKYLLKYTFETSKYAGCVAGGYGMLEFMEAETFKNYIDVEFCGLQLRGIAAYHLYLTQHYGNYLELPPVEERKPKHQFTCWQKEI